MNTQFPCLTLFALFLAVAGCAEAPTEIVDIQPEAATPTMFNAAGAPTVEFSVPDMMCPEGCGEKTKEILAGQPGAKDVQIDFESKTATVAVEEREFDAEQALAALVDHGFDHSALKDAAPPEIAPQREAEAAATTP